MHSLNILWQKRHSLLIILLSLVAILPTLPIFKSGTNGVFYNMDPEMALIGNALSYTKNGIIYYRDHPGTPTISLISLSFVPLRIYAKFIAHDNFISWTFNHFRFLFLYVRYGMILLFLTSTLVYLSSIYRISKSIWVVIFSLFSVLAFSFTPRMGGAVLTENLSYLLISLWLLFLVKLNQNDNPLLTVAMFLLSGYAIGNKYNNFPLLVVTIAYILSSKGLDTFQKMLNILVGGILSLVGFFIAIWPIRESFVLLIKQILKVLFQSGPNAAHGTSETLTAFDLGSYISSTTNYYRSEPLAFTMLCIFFLIILVDLFMFRIMKAKSNHKILFQLVAVFISAIFILKYPLGYYQFPSYLLIVFYLSYFLAKVNKYIVILITFIVGFFCINNLKNYEYDLIKNINNSILLENRQEFNPPKTTTLWDYGPAEDFMKIWIRGWTGGIYDIELRNHRPDILELKSDYQTVYLNLYDHKSIFDVCWDKLYIRENRALVFLDLYKQKKFEVTPIGNTGIWEIKSNHCTTKP